MLYLVLYNYALNTTSKEYISRPSDWFDTYYEDHWITDDLSRKMIKDVDKSEVVGNNNIYSEFLGNFAPVMLSSGCKGLLYAYKMANKNNILNGEHFGDNCWIWVNEIGKLKDITVKLNHSIPIDFIPHDFKAVVLDTRFIEVNGKKEFLDIFLAIKYR